MKYLFKILLLISFFFLAKISSAQSSYTFPEGDTTSNYRFKLSDGSVFIGNIIAQDSGMIVIKTSSLPRVQIPFNQISSFEKFPVID